MPFIKWVNSCWLTNGFWISPRDTSAQSVFAKSERKFIFSKGNNLNIRREIIRFDYETWDNCFEWYVHKSDHVIPNNLSRPWDWHSHGRKFSAHWTVRFHSKLHHQHSAIIDYLSAYRRSSLFKLIPTEWQALSRSSMVCLRTVTLTLPKSAEAMYYCSRRFVVHRNTTVMNFANNLLFPDTHWPSYAPMVNLNNLQIHKIYFYARTWFASKVK